MTVIRGDDLDREMLVALLISLEARRPLRTELLERFAVLRYCRRCQVKEVRYLHELGVGILPWLRFLLVESLAERQRNDCGVERPRARPHARPVLVFFHHTRSVTDTHFVQTQLQKKRKRPFISKRHHMSNKLS